MNEYCPIDFPNKQRQQKRQQKWEPPARGEPAALFETDDRLGIVVKPK